MLESILKSIFSAGTFQQMLRSATPVALAALGGSLTEHAGIMNIGMDGMILMGAFFGVLGSWLFASAAAGVVLAVGVGLLVGLFFALFVVKLRSDEFIIGCALNTFALGLTGFLSRSIFGASGTKGNPFLPSLRLPGIESIPFLGKILSGNSLFVYLTLLFVLLLWLFLYKTPYGFWLRASGEKPETLRTAGIDPAKLKWLASILCGVFCALAGAHLSLGQLQGTFAENMSNNRGYIAFACVIFGAANPPKASARIPVTSWSCTPWARMLPVSSAPPSPRACSSPCSADKEVCPLWKRRIRCELQKPSSATRTSLRLPRVCASRICSPPASSWTIWATGRWSAGAVQRLTSACAS